MNKKRPDLASFKTTERGYLKRNRQTEKEEMKSRNIRIRIDKSFKVHFDNQILYFRIRIKAGTVVYRIFDNKNVSFTDEPLFKI